MTHKTTQSWKKKPKYDASITLGQDTSMQDQQVWEQLVKPDKQGTQLVPSLEDEAGHAKGDQSQPKEPSGKEALKSQGNVSVPTLIDYLANRSNTKPTQQSIKAAAQEQGEAVNAARVLNAMTKGTR